MIDLGRAFLGECAFKISLSEEITLNKNRFELVAVSLSTSNHHYCAFKKKRWNLYNDLKETIQEINISDIPTNLMNTLVLIKK